METSNGVPIRIDKVTPVFTNAAKVTVSDSSVVLQFVYVHPDSPSGKLLAEVSLSPKHAIGFSKALDATIKKHFTRHLFEEAP